MKKLALLLLLAPLLLAADNPAASPVTSFDPLSMILPPPPPDSDECQAEFALLLQLQQSRTPEQVDRITRANSISMSNYTSAVGPWFTPEKLPRLTALLLKVNIAANTYNNQIKVVYMHPRPGDADPKHLLHPLFAESDPGYPSGHTVCSTVDALILAQLMPDLKDPLIAHAQQLSWDRVIAGMHYPSDIHAGRTLGTAIAQLLLANPNFQADLAIARTELLAARPASTRPAPK